MTDKLKPRQTSLLSAAMPFERVHHAKFSKVIRALVSSNRFYANNLDVKPSYKYCECWLMRGHSNGFAVSPDRELINVFSRTKEGERLLKFAMERYSHLHLNCYGGGFLEHFYTGAGFKIVKREPNWNAVEKSFLIDNPKTMLGEYTDVIYMEWRNPELKFSGNFS